MSLDLAAYGVDSTLREFRKAEMILEDGTPYGEAFESWQEDAIFLPLHNRKLTRLWLQRERGASKTSSLAWYCLECLLFEPEPFKIVVAASDEDQAGLLRAALWGFVVRNPDLKALVNVEKLRATVGENELTILSSDAASSTGLNADLYLFEELGQWDGDLRKRFFENLWTGIGKRKGQRVVVATNAGWSGDWRKSLRDLFARQAAKSPAWYYYSPERPPLPGWIDAEERAAQAEVLPSHVADRLFGNVWSSGGGSALSARELDALFTLSPTWYAGTLDPDEAQVFAGLDVGLKHDAAAVVAVVLTAKGTRLLSLRRWMPSGGEDVQLSEIEEAVLTLCDVWPRLKVLSDPWQSAGLIQRLQAKDVQIEECVQSGPQLHRQAATFLGLVRGARLALFDDPVLRQDLADAEVTERSYGFRLQSPRSKAGGHGDLLTGLQLACYGASLEDAEDAAPLDPDLDRGFDLAHYGILLPTPEPADEDAANGWDDLGEYDVTGRRIG